jgi:phage terminase large subunit-like protein
MFQTAELVRNNPWIPTCPTVKQLRFLSLPHREALFGGSAGGGKSEAMLMDAAQYVDYPQYAAILFRRTYADLALPGALMDRAFEWWSGTAAKWDDRNKTWRFPSGATITFGYMDGPRDKYRYQGAEVQYCGFDEATQFEEPPVMYLHSRLRKLQGSRLPIKFRLASNPGGIGHEWVYDRFIVNQNDERIFIPALLQENPHLDQEEYERGLEELDPVTRDQLLKGLWITDPAGKPFKRDWWQGQNRYDPTDWQIRNKVIARYAAFDTANKKKEDNAYTAVVVGEVLPDYRLLIRHVDRQRKDFSELIDYMGYQIEPWDYDHKMREVAIEDAASGTQALQVLNAGGGPMWLRSRARPVSPAKSKEEVWEAASLWCARDMVLLPVPDDSVPWLGDFEREIFNVPETTFKDQADAFSILINFIEEYHRSFSTRWRAQQALQRQHAIDV